MHKSIIPILLLFLFVSWACSHKEQSVRLRDDWVIRYKQRQPLDSFAHQIREFYQLPAVGIGIIDSDGVITTSVIGNSKTENGIALNKQSKFQIASCTKSFTALLVAILVSEGKLRWSTTVKDVFNDMKIHPLNRKITILELLIHTSGLPQFWTDEEVFEIDSLIPGLEGSVGQQRKKFIDFNLRMPPTFNKGEYHYSNAGYIVVAAMLEKITGHSYESLINKRIFEPLRLTSAEFGYSYLNDENQPHRHLHRNENGVGILLQSTEWIPLAIFNSCGFISLSMEDFALYISHCIQLQSGKSLLLPKNISEKLFENYHTLPNGFGVGLGWQIIEINSTKTFGHTGSDQTVRAAMAINPRKKTGVVFATNIGDYRSEQALVNVIHELINK